MDAVQFLEARLENVGEHVIRARDSYCAGRLHEAGARLFDAFLAIELLGGAEHPRDAGAVPRLRDRMCAFAFTDWLPLATAHAVTLADFERGRLYELIVDLLRCGDGWLVTEIQANLIEGFEDVTWAPLA